MTVNTHSVFILVHDAVLCCGKQFYDIVCYVATLSLDKCVVWCYKE
jgi:hypothetical protein